MIIAPEEKAIVADHSVVKSLEFGGFLHLFKDAAMIPNCGKWMHFFAVENAYYVVESCLLALRDDVCSKTKLTAEGSGVAYFYVDVTDIAAHQRVLRFMLDRGLIQKTKAGRLHNISFKLDRGRMVDDNDQPVKVTLSDFLDLDTGKFY